VSIPANVVVEPTNAGTVNHMIGTTDAATARNIRRIADEKKVPLAQLGRATRGMSEERLRAYLVHGKGSLLVAEVEAIAAALGVDPADLVRGVAA